MAKGPGRAHREGLTLIELFDLFPDDAAAEAWFEAQRWPEGRFCPACGSTETVAVPSRRPMPYRCYACRSHFSVRKGTVMQSSKLGLRKWALAIYLMTTGLKGTPSMKVYREIGVTQKTAWFLMQRIREGFMGDDDPPPPMRGGVEVDETYIGGIRRFMHADRRKAQPGGGGVAGKKPVVGLKERRTRRIVARVTPDAKAHSIWPLVREHVRRGSTIYTDQAPVYKSARRRGYRHGFVDHLAGEYVKGEAHTQGIDSFWSMFKRGYRGTYHRLSDKHLNRYIQEFVGRHNVRDRDTVEQMCLLARGMIGRRLRYRDLIA